jgi:hypothetical protein
MIQDFHLNLSTSTYHLRTYQPSNLSSARAIEPAVSDATLAAVAQAPAPGEGEREAPAPAEEREEEAHKEDASQTLPSLFSLSSAPPPVDVAPSDSAVFSPASSYFMSAIPWPYLAVVTTFLSELRSFLIRIFLAIVAQWFASEVNALIKRRIIPPTSTVS